MVFVGNTSHTVPYMLKHSDLFDELPEAYHDPAYLDRLHFYIPGWEVETIRGEMFSNGYGFVVDYLAEVLRRMRDLDFSDRYQERFALGTRISTRDRDGIHKTFSGLMKLLYPHGEATDAEIEELLRFAIEGRKRVKDQILRIDSTMAEVEFGYVRGAGGAGEWVPVTTLEEDEHPTLYARRRSGDANAGGAESPLQASGAGPDVVPAGARGLTEATPAAASPDETAESELFVGHRDFQENQRGVSYETLLLPYLRGATELTIVDPYIRQPIQGRNLADLLALLALSKDAADEISVTLITKADEHPDYEKKQLLMLVDLKESAAAAGIELTVVWDDAAHDRSIRTDTGWRIILGRGLDIFQKGSGSYFDLATSRQEFRQVKPFGVTYIREDDGTK